MSPGEINQHILANVPEEKLDRLLQAYGVAKEFIEFSGAIVQTPLENRVRILEAMGVSADTEAEVDALLELETLKQWEDWVQPVVVISPQRFALRIISEQTEAATPMQWHIDLENKKRKEGEFVWEQLPETETLSLEEKVYRAHELELPELPLGYHHLTLGNGEKWVTTLLIVSPERCFEPEWLQQRQRVWGLSVQLYALCSKEDWGMGNFSDLRCLIEQSALTGADFILLNPLHALDNRDPENASPYSPVDRRFLNPLYIDPGIEEDYLQAPAISALLVQPGFVRMLQDLREAGQVDYTGTFNLKYRVFDLMYQYFRERQLAAGTSIGKEFERYIADSELIRAFSDFQARIEIPEVRSATDPHFHMYLQWVAEKQLAACQALAEEKGMRIGLIRDLAVGGGIESCEVSSNVELFCRDARIGAPPDNFNPDGQNWGLPPLRPDILRQTRYSHFINLLRANMKSCGALRIDHVMGLMRLWWCPTDGTNAAGAYVHYPVDELFAILRLESARSHSVVIGEDLGVVPPEIRTYIDHAAVLSNVIFYFEKYDSFHFKEPEHYPRQALAMVANHDVPPLKAWWNKSDISLRRKLNLIKSDEQQQHDSEFRDQEKCAVLDWLDQQDLLPDIWHDRNISRAFDDSLLGAILGCCGLSASLLVSVQLDDIAGMDVPANIPGTSSEYLNWRRKIKRPVKDLFNAETTQTILTALNEARA